MCLRAPRLRSCGKIRPTKIRCRPTRRSTAFLSGWSIARIVESGFDRKTVVKVERLLNLAGYKRRQAAPGVKVTLRNFGRDRRYPIVNKFRDPGTPLPVPDATVSALAKAKSEA